MEKRLQISIECVERKLKSLYEFNAVRNSNDYDNEIKASEEQLKALKYIRDGYKEE